MSRLLEVNFDGLVGPTHNYAGLSYGNVASTSNVGSTSRPRAAALQGIAKMRRLMSLGVRQGVLPPHERPYVAPLRAMGFHGHDSEIIETVAKTDPVLLAQVSSASAMWTANAATVSPSIDTYDFRTHLLTANLVSMFHRSIEHPTTATVLRAVFSNPSRFVVHPALPSTPATGDEGAANHTRLFDDQTSAATDARSLHLFVYGAAASDKNAPRPTRFPARQTLEASRAAARTLALDPESASALFLQQNPAAIDAGVFHNDVIAVGSGRVLLYHESAFMDGEAAIAAIRERLPALVPVRIAASEVSVEAAVKSYLFNSQLLAPAADRYLLVAPLEAESDPAVKAAIDRVIADKANPISEAVYIDVRESMRNGGGPACLRLRVPLTEGDFKAVNPACIMDERSLAALERWVTTYYPEELTPADLGDPTLLRETRDALDALTKPDLLDLGNVYDFQR